MVERHFYMVDTGVQFSNEVPTVNIMNYLITLKCPKKCSFCFSKKLNELMSFTDFQEFIQHDKKVFESKRISLLGGEPTTHPEFGKFLNYALEQYSSVSVFSNLMVPKKNIEDFVKLASTYGYKLRVIWNNSEINYSSKLEAKSIDIAIKLTQTGAKMYHSVTYTPGLELAYLLPIAKKTNIYKLRFALNVADMKILASDENIKFLIKQLQLLDDNGFTVSLDSCGFIPVIVNPLMRLQLIKFFGSYKQCSGSIGADILPDGRLIPCMPYLEDPKDVYLTKITNREHLMEEYVAHYGPQSYNPNKNDILCPAYFHPNRIKGKIIPISLV